jgi:2-polyprenyl-3-methyl-5-hydroxy-6-metoxy-1,4-benzoquinol methylase
MKDYSKGANIPNDKLNRHHRLFFRAFNPAGRYILDAGCGRGLFLRTLLDKGAASVLGIDPAPENVASAEAHGVQCLRGFFGASIDLGGFTPDTITLFEVIEHVYDPHILIDAARAHLRPGGKLFVSTPNAFNIARALKFVLHQRHHDTHMDPVIDRDAQHIRAFSYGMVRDLLALHGFKDIRAHSRRPVPRYTEQIILMSAKR